MTEPQKQLVAAIDLGTTKVAAAVAEATGDPRHPSAKVLGIGVERTQGVRRGVVRDPVTYWRGGWIRRVG